MRHVLSLGAGVQSSTLALLSAHGIVKPMPECGIFADTGWEPKAVYDWLEWLKESLPFPVHTVSNGDLRQEQIRNRHNNAQSGHYAALPYFVLNPDGSFGMSKRQCTTDYKIAPIESFIKRELLGYAKGARMPTTPVITSWRGISADEASRMKPSRDKWIEVRYPLAMELNMTRADCLAWMRRNLYPEPPRSACIGCPFHSDDEWRQMRDERPKEWKDAIEFDAAIRKAEGMRGETFLHGQRVPLSQVDLSTPADRGQASLWEADCEGMCGV